MTERWIINASPLIVLAKVKQTTLLSDLTEDVPPLTEKFFKTAKWRKPQSTVKVTIEVEPEVIEWFKAQGENYERYLAAALRIYAQAHVVPENT